MKLISSGDRKIEKQRKTKCSFLKHLPQKVLPLSEPWQQLYKHPGGSCMCAVSGGLGYLSGLTWKPVSFATLLLKDLLLPHSSSGDNVPCHSDQVPDQAVAQCFVVFGECGVWDLFQFTLWCSLPLLIYLCPSMYGWDESNSWRELFPPPVSPEAAMHPRGCLRNSSPEGKTVPMNQLSKTN